MSIEAYILIETMEGKTRDVARSLRQVEHMKAVDIVAGPIDIIFKLEATDLTVLGEVLCDEIHAIPGINRTTSYLVA